MGVEIDNKDISKEVRKYLKSLIKKVKNDEIFITEIMEYYDNEEEGKHPKAFAIQIEGILID